MTNMIITIHSMFCLKRALAKDLVTFGMVYWPLSNSSKQSHMRITEHLWPPGICVFLVGQDSKSSSPGILHIYGIAIMFDTDYGIRPTGPSFFRDMHNLHTHSLCSLMKLIEKVSLIQFITRIYWNRSLAVSDFFIYVYTIS